MAASFQCVFWLYLMKFHQTFVIFEWDLKIEQVQIKIKCCGVVFEMYVCYKQLADVLAQYVFNWAVWGSEKNDIHRMLWSNSLNRNQRSNSLCIQATSYGNCNLTHVMIYFRCIHCNLQLIFIYFHPEFHYLLTLITSHNVVSN